MLLLIVYGDSILKMNKQYEQHIIILLGVSSRTPKLAKTISEKMLYMLFFLVTKQQQEEYGVIDRYNYKFRKGLTIPESPELRLSLRTPHFYRDCYIITEAGIILTQSKGVPAFRKLISHPDNKHILEILEIFTRLIQEIVNYKISEIELEMFIQLKYPDLITKYADSIESVMKLHRLNPLSTDRTQLLKHLEEKDFISETIKRAALVQSFEMKSKFFGAGS
jgi:hypothetical protein